MDGCIYIESKSYHYLLNDYNRQLIKIYHFECRSDHHMPWSWLLHIYQNASDTPFIEAARIDDHTIGDFVNSEMNGWIFHRIQQKTKHVIELPNYDFLAVFTRLLYSCYVGLKTIRVS